MSRLLKSKKEYIGLSPDSLLFRGEKKIDDTIVQLMRYDVNSILEQEVNDLEEINNCITYKNSWINIYGLHDQDIMRSISEQLSIDSIIMSEILNTHSRPRVVEYEDCLYVSAKMISLKNTDDVKIDTENIAFILKNNQLISFQERKGDVFKNVRERLRNGKRRIRKLNSDYLLFALIDVILDNYTYVISKIGENIEVLDEQVLSATDQSILVDINAYKRELVYLHKSIYPCKEMIFNLIKLESEFIDSDNENFYKELQSNINNAVDSLNNYKEILSNLLNIYHTQVSSRLNDIMKFLTVFSVIFIPLTFIAGIYGTNFEFIPELKLKFGYPLMLILMLVTAGGMLFYFKKKKWI
ncbi:magnesium/cobalt transporter CorA [Labilibacter marinus]|uniref:magnesium/cobalt transporter CorA n=1 Tax=Labilibacter marinus TaxID=1477105 RepID=UPI00094F92B3|nr:magnesium/cobalt transporter CorA [Labilibacter marinus]